MSIVHKGVPALNLRSASLTGHFMLVLALISLVIQNSFWASGYIAITVQLIAVLLMIWARTTLGRRSFHSAPDPTQGGLVTTGPYAYIRHPIYASILYFLW